MSAFVDTSYWPILHVDVAGDVSEADVHTLSEGLAEVLARRERFASFTDLRGITTVPGATERRLIAAWLRELEPQLVAYNVGGVNLFQSSVVRGALSALHWVFRPTYPQYLASSVDDGVRWCETRLVEAGIDPGTAVSRLTAHLESREHRASGITRVR